jgi:hypothetical protein
MLTLILEVCTIAQKATGSAETLTVVFCIFGAVRPFVVGLPTERKLIIAEKGLNTTAIAVWLNWKA